MVTYGRCVDAAPDRKHVGQQIGGCRIGHERGPARLEVQALRRNMIGKQLLQWRDRCRTVGLPPLRKVVARALEPDIAEQSPEGKRVAALAPELATADWAVPVFLEPAIDLSLNDPLLSGCQQSLALGQGQAQILGSLGDLR